MERRITSIAAVCSIVSLACAGRLAQPVSAGDASGGIVIHLGRADIETLKDLHAGGRFTVQVLDRDEKRVADLRKRLSTAGIYGSVSARVFSGDRLPYVNDLINMVVADGTMGVSDEEIFRVLCPFGEARIRSGKMWRTLVKPWPDDIDEWTHFLHNPTGNAVAADERIGTPRHLQWFDLPLHNRSHEINNSCVAMVSGGGRIYYAFDKGVTGMEDARLPAKWTLFARDAFNGKILWERPLPKWSVEYWGNPSMRFFNGTMARRLVASGDRIYCTVDIGGPVHVVDGLSGRTLRVIEGTENALEIIVSGDHLICATGPVWRLKDGTFRIVCHDLKQEKTLWAVDEKMIDDQTLVVGPREVLYHNGQEIVCLDRTDGKVRWRFRESQNDSEPDSRRSATFIRGGGVETLLVAGDKAVLAAWNKLIVLSVASGNKVWEVQPYQGRAGVMGRSDVFHIHGRIWLATGGSIVGAYDLETGEKTAQIDVDSILSRGHHLRCYRAKATNNYLISQFRGIEFLSLKDEIHCQNDWVRGTCTYGVMPANGLLYSPPNPCFCYPGAQFHGFAAFSRETGDLWANNGGIPGVGPLERGPAYSSPLSNEPAENSWPSYRHDARRSGSTKSPLPESLTRSWEKSFGTRLTQPVVADGRLYVAVKDNHQVVALESASGKELWTFTADARIDSSPSIYGGVILFGCSDGYLYCVKSDDGQLVWRRRMAPAPDRWIASEGQLESAWRLHGSVLIQGGLAYTCAGRSSFLDGGLFLAAVDIASGAVVHEARLDTRMNTREDHEENKFVAAFHIEGANSDLLTAEGGFIYLNLMKFTPDLKRMPMRYSSKEEATNRPSINLDNKPYINEAIFDLEATYSGRNNALSDYGKMAELMPYTKAGGQLGILDLGRHLFTTSGFLDDSFYNRSFWMHSAVWPGHNHAVFAPKSGQLLVIGEKNTYALKTYNTRYKITPTYTAATKGYLIVADANDNDPTLDPRAWSRMMGMGFSRGADPKWHLWLPVRVNAMVNADDKLAVCGAPDVLDEKDPLASFEGRMGSRLWVISAEDGKVISKQELTDASTFDGMMAAEGRLYIVTQSGKLICMGHRCASP